MEIRLIKTSVLELHYTPNGEAHDELRCAPVYREDQPCSFAVIFDVKAAFKPSGALILKYFALFETTGEIDDTFRNGHFPRVNAPAVAYPYVRAFISQFSSLTGAETYTLPIKNFVKMPPPALAAKSEQLESP